MNIESPKPALTVSESTPTLRNGYNFWQTKTLEQLAEEQHVKPIARVEEVAGTAAGLWDSDEDFESFLQAARRPQTERA